MNKIYGMTDFKNDKHIERLIRLIDMPSALRARTEVLTNLESVEYIQDLGKFLGGRLEFRLVFDVDKSGSKSE